jgi:Uma2 family endonuclease
MPPSTETRATIDDLYREEGKAELIGGRIIRYMTSGLRPSRVALRIYRRLADHADSTGRGEAYADGLGYEVPELSSGRESFEPDTSYYFGPFPKNETRFIAGPPTFAVEVRSENDYGAAAEIAMAAKRADYFEAGTAVVWDVDPVAELIHLYRQDDPAQPTTLARGEIADAEPAVPDWRIAVDEVFGPVRQA